MRPGLRRCLERVFLTFGRLRCGWFVGGYPLALVESLQAFRNSRLAACLGALLACVMAWWLALFSGSLASMSPRSFARVLGCGLLISSFARLSFVA